MAFKGPKKIITQKQWKTRYYFWEEISLVYFTTFIVFCSLSTTNPLPSNSIRFLAGSRLRGQYFQNLASHKQSRWINNTSDSYFGPNCRFKKCRLYNLTAASLSWSFLASSEGKSWMLQIGKRAKIHPGSEGSSRLLAPSTPQSLGSKISKMCTCMPRRAPGPQDRCITPSETCGVLLLLPHQQEPTADVTWKSFWAARGRQAATLLSRLTGPSMPSGTPSRADFLTKTGRPSFPRSYLQNCSEESVQPWERNSLKPISLNKNPSLLPLDSWQPWRTAPSISLQFTLAGEACSRLLRQFSTAPVSCSCLIRTVRSFEQEERHTGLVSSATSS